MNLFVTGYGPFLNVTENPSGLIAARLGLPYRVIDVTFSAADAFLDEFAAMDHDALLMIGVAGIAGRMRIETVARNHIGPTPDVADVVMGPGPVHADSPAHLHSSLWAGFEQWVDGPDFEPSVDTGSYLCNYLSFEAARRFPDRRTGFLHVPLPRPGFGVEEMADAIRRCILGPLLAR
ncbi:MAG: hypothetical protein IT363_14430 [Methanoregulaceae archaeon]|nr:hypothetical protein [Methanoregulaceae archaeon]